MQRAWIIFIASCLLAMLGCGSPPPQESPPTAISKAKAMAIATNFVIEQGYTSFEPDLSVVSIVVEKSEFATDTAMLVKNRQNMLLAKAIGARKYKEGTKWAVAFEYTEDVNNIGRCVTMDTLGQQIYIQTDDIRLDWIFE